MLPPKEFFDFIANHATDDPLKLRLGNYASLPFDVANAIDQIQVRQKAKGKLPSWSNNAKLLFPSGISFEQCSSEITAHYKTRFCNGTSVCDLTGGLGVDTLAFASIFSESTYVERFPSYCDTARYNFELLGRDNIRIVNQSCETFVAEELQQGKQYDTLYIDPARRGEGNKRLFALAEYEPNVAELLPLLLQLGKQLIIKVSPMVDIAQAMAELPLLKEIHILSVKNDCKELLLVITPNTPAEVTVHCLNFASNEACERYSFIYHEEHDLQNATYAKELSTYLYEPNASVMKGGAFKKIANDFALEKLEINSHLYTSEQCIERFPGRVFQVIEMLDYSGKTAKTVKSRYPKANITARNFPLSVKELRQKTGIKEGGDIYLFATTLYPNKKVLVVTRKQE